MKGRIFKINRLRRMVAIQTENGDFSVYEQIITEDSSANVGDEVEWTGDGIIGEVLMKNHTQSARGIVFFRYHRVPLTTLNSRLLFKT